MILFIKHIDIEGPETLEEFFLQKGYVCQTIELWQGVPLPESCADLRAVISLGGPMNVYEEQKYPFLEAEHKFIQKVIAAEIPFLGLCLGSQLLAKAAGVKVEKSPAAEIGFYPVKITAAGKTDPLFAGLKWPLKVFQWHEDTFAIPQKGLLAEGEQCPNQAFRIGPCAYGLQFHIEITEQSINQWCDAYWDMNNKGQRIKKDALLAAYQEQKEKFHLTANQIYNNFLQLINRDLSKGEYDTHCSCAS